MGVIRIFFLIYLCFLTLDLFSKGNNDTIYFSAKKHVKHIVQAGESLKSIAILHNVSTSDIRESNELSRRLYYKQLLYIPIYLSTKNDSIFSVKKLIIKDKNSDTALINIALLMPYYLIKNDKMFNESKDSLDLFDRYYSKSELALSFHIGLNLALDSLRRTGKNIVLHTFDTNKDSIELKRIVYSNQLDDMDIIIGPLYSSLFEILCRKYGFDNTKLLISPLSRVNDKIIKYSSAYQISLTYKTQVDIIFSYLIKKAFDKRIIILNDERERDIAAYLMYQFKKHQKLVDTITITDTHVDLIRRNIEPEQVVVLFSKDRSFVSRVLGSIGGIDSISTVFAFESILSYDYLDITNLMELDVHIVSSKVIDFSDKYDLNFVSSFENVYNTNFRKYSKVGYDIGMHFCGNKNIFKFKKLSNGYNENRSAAIYHYVDYELIPVN